VATNQNQIKHVSLKEGVRESSPLQKMHGRFRNIKSILRCHQYCLSLYATRRFREKTARKVPI